MTAEYNRNKDVTKFGLPILMIEHCFNKSQIFAIILKEYIGGKIIQINDNKYVVLYRDFYIDSYGIHTYESLKNRKISIFDRSQIYNSNDKFELKESTEYKFSSQDNIYIEYIRFIVNIIINGNTFKNFKFSQSINSHDNYTYFSA